MRKAERHRWDPVLLKCRRYLELVRVTKLESDPGTKTRLRNARHIFLHSKCVTQAKANAWVGSV
jgi:hypothetical protein